MNKKDLPDPMDTYNFSLSIARNATEEKPEKPMANLTYYTLNYRGLVDMEKFLLDNFLIPLNMFGSSIADEMDKVK